MVQVSPDRSLVCPIPLETSLNLIFSVQCYLYCDNPRHPINCIFLFIIFFVFHLWVATKNDHPNLETIKISFRIKDFIYHYEEVIIADKLPISCSAEVIACILKARWIEDGELAKQNGTMETIIIPLNVVIHLLFN